nr:immunoglobulin light chain junction region [Macaca mulatta]
DYYSMIWHSYAVLF